MKTNIHYILLTAMRDWLFAGLLLGVLFAVMISSAMGDMAMLEPEQLKISYSAAASRLVLVIGMIVFTCFHVRHAFDSKEIDVFLSRPISRPNLVVSYWLGFSFVAVLLALPTIAVVQWVGPLSMQGFWLWSLTLVLELVLVVAAALFSSFTLKSGVSSVMATFGFYVLARMMGFFIATANSALLFRSEEMNNVSRWVMDHLAMVVPRLDFFAKTNWLVYGIADNAEIYNAVLQAVIFILVLLAATVVDFRRKQF